MLIFDAESHGDDFFLIILFHKQKISFFKMTVNCVRENHIGRVNIFRNIFIEELNLTWLIVYGDHDETDRKHPIFGHKLEKNQPTVF